MPPEFAILTTSSELEQLEPQWKALWLEDPNATPFQSPEWLLPWWRHFGQRELRAVRISDARGLLALLPFYLLPDEGWGEQRLLLLGAGTSDYLDGLFSPRCTEENIRDGIDLLRKEDCSWGQLDILQLRPQSPLGGALASMGGEPIESEPCSCIAATLLDDLPKKIRRNVTLSRNRAERLGPVAYALAGESQWEESLEALHRLHAQRWQSRGIVADDRVHAWHREVMPVLLQSGLARLNVLRVEGAIAAVLWSLCDPPERRHRTEYFYMTAFDPQFAECSPGSLLYALTMDRARREGFAKIDLLRGTEGYKRLWRATPLPTQGWSLARLRVAVAA